MSVPNQFTAEGSRSRRRGASASGSLVPSHGGEDRDERHAHEQGHADGDGGVAPHERERVPALARHIGDGGVDGGH
jgi:hypothetical protein